MKTLGWALLMSTLLWPACNVEQNSASQNPQSQTESARQQRQEFQDKAEAELRELDREVEALRARVANSVNKDDRDQMNRQISELDRKRAEARAQLEKLKNSSQEAWQDMEAGFDAAMHDLETAYDQASSRFKK